jgi:hypothetical protein
MMGFDSLALLYPFFQPLLLSIPFLSPARYNTPQLTFHRLTSPPVILLSHYRPSFGPFLGLSFAAHCVSVPCSSHPKLSWSESTGNSLIPARPRRRFSFVTPTPRTKLVPYIPSRPLWFGRSRLAPLADASMHQAAAAYLFHLLSSELLHPGPLRTSYR